MDSSQESPSGIGGPPSSPDSSLELPKVTANKRSDIVSTMEFHHFSYHSRLPILLIVDFQMHKTTGDSEYCENSQLIINVLGVMRSGSENYNEPIKNTFMKFDNLFIQCILSRLRF